MPKYRLLPNKKHWEGGSLLPAGSVVEMSEERYRGLQDRFTPVGGHVVTQDAGGEDVAEGTDWSFLADENVPDIKKILGGVDDLDDLDAIHASEARGKSRTGVFDAIDARRRAIEEEAEDEEGDEDEDEG